LLATALPIVAAATVALTATAVPAAAPVRPAPRLAAPLEEGCDLGSDSAVFAGESFRVAAQCSGVSGARYRWWVDAPPGPPETADAAAQMPPLQPGHYLLWLAVLDSAGEESGRYHRPLTVVNRPTPAHPTHSSPIAFDALRNRVWCVNRDNGSVTAVDAATRERLFEAPCGREPRTLALDSAGNVWVTLQDDAALAVLDGRNGAVLRKVALPRASRPFGICFAPGGSTAYVTLEALGQVLKLEAATGRILAKAEPGPSPRGMALTGDGKRLFVTRFLSPVDHGQVAEIDPESFAVTRTHRLALDPGPDGESNSRGVPNYLSSLTLSPDGRTAWIPSIKDNTERGLARDGLKPTFETSVRAIVSTLDLTKPEGGEGRRLDLDNRALASAVEFSRYGDYAFTASEGTNDIVVHDAYSGQELTALLSEGEESMLAPEGMATDPDHRFLYVAYFLSREMGIFDIGSGNSGFPRLALVKTVARESLDARVLHGKRIFYNAKDTRMSRDGYISCAVCHLDGAADGRVWDFTDRGEGLRRTLSMLGRAGAGQGPIHWSANFDEVQDFENDMRGPFEGTGFMSDADFATAGKTLGPKKAGLSPDLDALAAYVSSLNHARPSPYRNADGTLTAEAVAGQAIFQREDVGCARCHVPPSYTDSRFPAAALAGSAVPGTLAPGDFLTPQGFLVHDVGTLNPAAGNRLGDTLRGFDTPTLKGIWEGGPFLHDGSAATLEEVLGKANPEDRHGRTSQLSAVEKAQLAAFLRQIDDGDPGTGIRAGRPFPQGPGSRVTVARLSRGMRIQVASGDASEVSIYSPEGRLLKRIAPEEFHRAADPKGGSGLHPQVWSFDWIPSRASGGRFFVTVRAPGRTGVAAAVWMAP
jgi:DNA-binding beta-propeller fold protein YncE